MNMQGARWDYSPASQPPPKYRTGKSIGDISYFPVQIQEVLKTILVDLSVLKVKYRRFPDFPNLFSKQICSSKTDFSTFSSSKKGTSTQPLSPTKISRRFGPKRASYIRIIGGNVSYIGFIGNIGGLSGLGLSFSSLSTSCSLCSLLRGKQNC